ncbi:uncharacterized protein LOC130712488 [Lotus japonicus]|uniref:uncharacterized protein LOC130712488 n=1 Tax=Lotus japonicus TaxID=34305 RepID=UPI00258AC992|nr:uncharacterized protein LOC130712488 [Lotus japonicus]
MRSLVLAAYNGQTGPKDHLLYFNMKMAISAASDAVKCRMLPSTFKGAAMAWSMALPRGSIAKFHDFSSQFLIQFSTSKIEPVTIEDLYDVRQMERETLKQYVKRYSDASRKIEESEPQACACAFKNGLLPGKLNNKLSRKPTHSMTEARARASAYILEEEDDTFKRKPVKAEKVSGRRNVSLAGKSIWRKEANSTRKDKDVVQFVEKFEGRQLCSRKEDVESLRPRWTTGPRRHGRPKRCSNEELAKLLQEVEVTQAVESGKNGIDSWRGVEGRTKWCEYHHLEGQDTSDCFTLKGKDGKLIRARRSRATDRESDKDQHGGRRRAPAAGRKRTKVAKKKGAEETFNNDVKSSV